MTADIHQVQKAVNDAELRANTDRLNTRLADDSLSIGERGYMLDKLQWIARHAEFLLPPHWTRPS